VIESTYLTDQILELVQGGFIKAIHFGGGGRFEDSFWEHLAKEPDCITFTTGDMDIERYESSLVS
jgi:hypothetical protein